MVISPGIRAWQASR